MPFEQRLPSRLRLMFAIAVMAGAHILAGCTTTAEEAAPPAAAGPSESAPPPSNGGAERAPAEPSTVIDDSAADAGPVLPKTEIVSGDGALVRPPLRRSGRAAGSNGVTLDFADADVKDVVRTVLGEILKVPYSIDPQVTGKVTLRTTSALADNDVIAALETVLKVNGAAIVFADNVYNVVPMAEAQRRIDGFDISGTAAARRPGYGIEIVPLRFVSAAEMQKILQPIAPQGGVVSVDAGRNLIFIAGTGQERASMLDTIGVFDVDYLKGMSFAIVRPEHVDAATLASDLKRVMERTSGSLADVIQFVPIARINTLLVVGPRAAQLRQVTKWVERLDVPPRGPGRRITLYRLQNAKAQDVAQSLAAVLGQSMPNAGGSAPALEETSAMLSSTGAPGAAAEVSVPAAAPPGAPLIVGGRDGPQIVADDANNALIIRADTAEYAMLEKFLKEVDVAPDQVLLEATIAEVTLNDKLKYGVEWLFENDETAFNLSKTGAVKSVFPGFAFTYAVRDVQVALNALDTITDINVISSPKLLTLNNRAAVLQVGDQVPVVTQQATGITDATAPTIVNSIQFRDTGVVLRVTPRIAKSGMVFVEVNQEVSDAVATTTSGIDSPTIRQRKLLTTVAVHDGDTIALGGLIRRSRTYGDSGVPVLKDIPVLGKLFGTTEDTDDRTELLIFIRPRIIANVEAAREMTQDLRDRLERLRVPLDDRPAPPRNGARSRGGRSH